MIEVRETNAFAAWLSGLRDAVTRAVIARRIARLAGGNFGDVKPIGEGLSELRVDYGPGFRVYLVKRGAALVVLLGGGDKSTQSRDIEGAKALAKEL